MKKYILTVIMILVTVQAANAFNWGTLLRNSAQPATTTKTTTYSNILNSLFSNSRTQVKQTTTSADVITALANFQNQAQSIDNSVQNSFLSVVSQLSTQQEANTLKSRMATILANNANTQIQKEELIDELISNYTQNLTANKTDIASIIKNMSASDKAQLANNLANLAQNSQQYITLAKKGTTTASTLLKASQNAQDIISTINTIRQTATTIKSRATTISNFVSKVRTISKYAGLFI